MDLFIMEIASQEPTPIREKLLQPESPAASLALNALSQAEAFAAIALAAVASDESLLDTEKKAIFLTLARMKLFEDYSEEQIKSMLANLLALFKKYGYKALVNSAKNFLQPDLRTTAFAVAIDLVLSDGVLHEKEKHFLDHLQDALELSDETAFKLIEVMLTKNRG